MAQNPLREPAVVGRDELDLDIGVGVHADFEHGLRKQDLDVDAHGLDRAPHQGQVAMPPVAHVDVLAQSGLMGDAAVDVLKGDARRMVAQGELARIRPDLRHHLAVAAQHRILDVIEDFAPGVELDVVRIDVHDVVVVKVVALNIALGVGQDFARIGVRW